MQPVPEIITPEVKAPTSAPAAGVSFMSSETTAAPAGQSPLTESASSSAFQQAFKDTPGVTGGDAINTLATSTPAQPEAVSSPEVPGVGESTLLPPPVESSTTAQAIIDGFQTAPSGAGETVGIPQLSSEMPATQTVEAPIVPAMSAAPPVSVFSPPEVSADLVTPPIGAETISPVPAAQSLPEVTVQEESPVALSVPEGPTPSAQTNEPDTSTQQVPQPAFTPDFGATEPLVAADTSVADGGVSIADEPSAVVPAADRAIISQNVHDYMDQKEMPQVPVTEIEQPALRDVLREQVALLVEKRAQEARQVAQKALDTFDEAAKTEGGQQMLESLKGLQQAGVLTLTPPQPATTPTSST